MLTNDCFLTDKERLTHAEALSILKERVSCVVGTETIPLAEAGGRILAETLEAPRPVPLADNAAVDGYAFNHADYLRQQGRLPLSFRLTAGRSTDQALPPQTAARIFTGAVMPAGADTVVMQEDTKTDGSDILVPPGLKPGANRRKAGEDLARGTVIAEPGRILRPQDIAAIASIGRADARVFERLKVALISTGNEIVRPPASLQPGEVYDSNHVLLQALLAGIGAETTDFGILPDDAETIARTLTTAAASHHVVISTGGASRGEEDHLTASLDRLGRRYLWQIAVKPGRPMAFGQIGDTPVLMLPGNPVAVMVCFLLYARPTLLALSGASWHEPTRFAVTASFGLTKKPDRREFLRASLDRSVFPPHARKYPRDGSGLITGLREADGLIELPEEMVSLAPGDPVAFIPLSEFGIVGT